MTWACVHLKTKQQQQKTLCKKASERESLLRAREELHFNKEIDFTLSTQEITLQGIIIITF